MHHAAFFRMSATLLLVIAVLPASAQLQRPIQVELLPDLVITEVRPAGEYYINCGPYQTGNRIEVSVTNQGRMAVLAEQPFNVMWAHDIMEAGAPMSSAIRTITGGLPVGATKKVMFEGVPEHRTALSTSTTGGPNFIVDFEQKIRESDETNNQSHISGHVTVALRSCPSFTISDVTVREGETATFRVALSAAPQPGREAKISYRTRNGTATGGSRCDFRSSADFVHATGTLTFPAGSTQAQIVRLPTCRDLGTEPNETFRLEITSTTNVAFEPGRSATATIIDQPAN
jgi:hypothetical protein